LNSLYEKTVEEDLPRVSNPYINLVRKLALSLSINLAHLVCPVKSALLPVYPMPGALDLADGRDTPIP